LAFLAVEADIISSRLRVMSSAIDWCTETEFSLIVREVS
jgi:hypothetical protein